MLDGLVSMLKSLQGKITYDPVTLQPSFGIGLGDIQSPEYTLEEIFTYLDSADKPCLVAIDEFQQIAEYEEKNIEALLRGHIQKMHNCHFVFAGSKQSIMSEMFQSPARPFYKSADPLELKPIDMKVYVEFASRLFGEYGKRIENSVIEDVYKLFGGYTFYMQRTFNEAFASVTNGGECTTQTISDALDDILMMNEVQFAEIFSTLSENQKRVLAAIASEEPVKSVNTSDFIGKYHLHTASTVNAAIRKLIKENLLLMEKREYSIPDKFLRLWINRMYNNA